MTGSGRTNALQATAGNASGGYNPINFTDIFTVTNTVGTTTNYLDTGAATNVPARYYRVRLVPYRQTRASARKVSHYRLIP